MMITVMMTDDDDDSFHDTFDDNSLADMEKCKKCLRTVFWTPQMSTKLCDIATVLKQFFGVFIVDSVDISTLLCVSLDNFHIISDYVDI